MINSKRLYRYSIINLVIIIFIIQFTVVDVADGGIAAGIAAYDLCKLAVTNFIAIAATIGTKAAGKKIFKKAWEYAQVPVMAVFNAFKSLIPNFFSKDSSTQVKINQAQIANNIIENDKYFEKLIKNEFSNLTPEQLDRVILTLLVTLSNKMDKSLNNQSTLLTNSFKTLDQQEEILEHLRGANPNGNGFIKGYTHFVDINDLIEFDYPSSFDAPQIKITNDEYSYVIGDDLTNGPSFWHFFTWPWVYSIEITINPNSASSRFSKEKYPLLSVSNPALKSLCC